MIRAICFNKMALAEEGFKELLIRLKARDGGTITFTANCVESFPDGTLYRSYYEHNQTMEMLHVTNCGDDLEKFVYVNTCGNKEKEPSFDELVQMVQDGEINMIEFVEMQKGLKEDFHDYMMRNKMDRTAETVEMFLSEVEEILTDSKLPYDLNNPDLVFMVN